MPEQILKNVYRIPVPLPGNPLKELNSYLIRGKERTVLIDTGFRMEPCRRALFAGLEELGVRREEVDVLLTHLHSDHAGLAPEVVGGTGVISISAADRAALDDQETVRRFWAESDVRYREEGFPAERLRELSKSNPAKAMAPARGGTYRSLADGERLRAGDYELTALSFPGHTPGQMCFWLEKEGAMFLGDHVLFDITPNITSWLGVEDSLGDYLDSLEKMKEYDVAVALPGHRKPGDTRRRVDALLEHHRARLDEALARVKAYPGSTAYDLAGRMTWQIRAADWETFPVIQKWFAVGECMSHLDYLRLRGLIRREMDNGVYRYF